MAASDRSVGQIELAAKALDLTAALLDVTGSSNSILRGAWEIGQWLGREKLNQYELLDCMKKSRSLVFANSDGQEFFNKVIQGTETNPVKPLFLQQSGSLGRLMAGDPSLSWIVSTVACLFQHHRDERLVAEKLTAFVMRSQPTGEDDKAVRHGDTFVYSGERTRLRAVVLKIVSSVWYNVINTGCDTISLPRELLDICPRGHFLDPNDFAIVTDTIHSRCPTKAILRVTFLPRDVILWLLLHYDGTVVVNAGGEIIYRRKLGNTEREVEVRVTSLCANFGQCDTKATPMYSIMRCVAGHFEDFLSGYSMESNDLPQQPGIRRELYEIPRLYLTDSPMWNKPLQTLMRLSAQALMRWLLEVPLKMQNGFSSLGFSTDIGNQIAAEQLTISAVLKRVPMLINFQWGTSLSSTSFSMTPGRAMASYPSETPLRLQNVQGPTESSRENELKILVEHFPILSELVKKMSLDCLCRDCGMWREPNSQLKSGCLKRNAIEEVLVLVAHGIGDAFGADRASSVLDATPMVDGMIALLLELIEQHKVLWDTWFAVASCVYLGCPFATPVAEDHESFGGTAFAAIQYGNLATQAPWLDLSQQIVVEGCFGLVGSSGRIGVISQNENLKAEFRSVEENFAVIETESAEDTIPFCSKHKKAQVEVQKLELVEDESSVDNDVILCQIDNRHYRMFLRVKTEHHWRTVDPSDALNAIIRLLPTATCTHSKTSHPTSQEALKVYSMDEVVGRWPDCSPLSTSDNATGGVLHLTNVLNSYLKINIALALAVCPTSLLNKPDKVCSKCMFSHARQSHRPELRPHESGNTADRYIINVHSQLISQGNFLGKRLISDGEPSASKSKGELCSSISG